MPEVPGGAHLNLAFTAGEIKKIILRDLKSLMSKSPEQLIRYRSKKIREIGHINENNAKAQDLLPPGGDESTSFPEDVVDVDILAYKQAWARLLSKVYEIDPLVCPKCGAEMKVIAVIENTDEIKRILRHPGCRAEQEAKLPTRLVKIGRPPPGLDLAQFN